MNGKSEKTLLQTCSLWKVSKFSLKCDCKKDILLYREGRSSDYKQSVTKSGVTIRGVHLYGFE